MASVGERTHQTPHFSFLRRRLAVRLPGARLEDQVVEELNRRGYLGAFGPGDVGGAPVAPDVTDEELLVTLAMPDAPAEGRHWKLIVRAVQRGTVDVGRLARLARLERADALLAWLMRGVPVAERTPSIEHLTRELRPRGPTPRIDYDFGRLERGPARREHGWRRPRS